MVIRTGIWLVVAVVATVAASLGSPAQTAAGGGGCRGRPSTEGAGTTVEMRGSCFQPTVLHVEAGQAVTWMNADSAPHSVAGATVEWGNYNAFGQGASVSYTFDQPGTYPYYCFEHNGMIGAIVVGDGRGTGAAQAVPAVAALRQTSAVAPEPEPAAAKETTESGSGREWLWLGAAAIVGMVAGGGIAVALRRPRR